VVINQQQSVVIDLAATNAFAKRLRRLLKLGQQDFNICFVADEEIGRLNARHRGKAGPTDVLSFPWQVESEFETRNSKTEKRISAAGNHDSRSTRRAGGSERVPSFDFRFSNSEFRHFLGDIVISAETARANARQEGHSTENEVRWLILHGLLHLLGYDHATDSGEMTVLELSLRERLGIAEESKSKSKGKGQRAKGKG